MTNEAIIKEAEPTWWLKLNLDDRKITVGLMDAAREDEAIRFAEWRGKCESDHLSINELLAEFIRKGFDPSNWDGDEGAEKAIVDGVCVRIDEVTDKLFEQLTDAHQRAGKLMEAFEWVNRKISDSNLIIYMKEKINEYNNTRS